MRAQLASLAMFKIPERVESVELCSWIYGHLIDLLKGFCMVHCFSYSTISSSWLSISTPG
jgi:hypothetical protein